MCRIFTFTPAGLFQAGETPIQSAIEDQQLLELIKEVYIASGATYGAPGIHREMREDGQSGSVRRVARIRRENTRKLRLATSAVK